MTKRGGSGQPVAIETALGWVLSGPLKIRESGTTEFAQVNLITESLKGWDEDSLENNVRKLWSFEGLGISEGGSVHEEFLDNISFTGIRYSVKLPWKVGHDELPDNYLNSLGRMKGQLRRLRKEPGLRQDYDSYIKE